MIRLVLLFSLSSIVLTLFPAALVYRAAGGNWQGVPPELITDSLYYYAQIHEVRDGYPKVGNPFFKEHQNEIAPAFFLPVDIAAIPMYFGASITATALIDLFFFTGVFLFLAYLILRACELPRMFAYLGSLIAYLGAYMFMVRPVAMQIVFPTFLFFLLSYLYFLRAPGRKSAVILGLGILLAPYTYTYLAYIVIGTMASGVISFLIWRKWNELKWLFVSGLISIIGAIPFLFGIFLPEIHHPLYPETIVRIGMVMTHIPANEFFYYGRWVLLVLVALLLVLRGAFRDRIRSLGDDPQNIFLLSSGAGLLIAAGSNIITGVELSLAIHIGRFIILWLSLAVAILGFRFLMLPRWEMRTPVRILGALLIIIMGVSLIRNIPRSFAFATKDNLSPTAELQTYAEPLRALTLGTAPGAVVWSNDTLARYIPIMTNDYVLYTEAGGLQLVGDTEMIDRYLVSRMGTSSEETLRSSIGKYLGAGIGKEQPIAINRSVAWCLRLKKIIHNHVCAEPTSGEQILGDQFFTELLAQSKQIQSNRIDTLRRFNVEYLLLDSTVDPTFSSFGVSGELKWSNDRFSIYRLSDE